MSVIVKNAVRERDGHKCTQCNMSAAEHAKKFQTKLNVHRLTPGEPYQVDRCVTLCEDCHRRAHGWEGITRSMSVTAPVSPELHAAVVIAAKERSMTVAAFTRWCVERQLEWEKNKPGNYQI